MCLLDKAVIIITSKDLAVKSTDLVLLNYLYISRFSYLQPNAHRRAFGLCRKIARPFFHLNTNETNPSAIQTNWSAFEAKGSDTFLHGRILFLDLLFTWIRANSVTDCSGVYTAPCKF